MVTIGFNRTSQIRRLHPYLTSTEADTKELSALAQWHFKLEQILCTDRMDSDRRPAVPTIQVLNAAKEGLLASITGY